MKFQIRGYIFEVIEQESTKDGMPQYAMKVTFEDGSYIWLSHRYGLCETESGCCYQAMLWMEWNGI